MGATMSYRQINHKDATGKSRQDMGIEPGAQQRSSQLIAPFCKQDADFQLLKGNYGDVQITRNHTISPIGNIRIRFS